MRLLKPLPFLVLSILFAALPAIAGEKAPKPRDSPQPPSYTLPPEEREPLRVYRSLESSGPDWGVIRLKVPDVWASGNEGAGVKVAVLDTGIDSNHPDLKSHIASPDDVKDFTGSRFGATDKQGHGTHCAGTILASGRLPGVAPKAGLIAGKVLGDNGSGGVDGISTGITWAIARNADVISMSLGGPGSDTWIPPTLKAAEEAGVIVVAAAGNEGPGANSCGYPGQYPQCITVAAVGRTGESDGLGVAGFSSRCPAVYVAAPGVAVQSTWPGGQYATISGTSMATPHVAGLAALWVAANPNVPKKERPARFREALKAACTDLAPSGRDTATGWGFPDAVKLAAAGPTIPQPMPRGVLIGWEDLSEAAKSRLRGQGVDAFKFELILKP